MHSFKHYYLSEGGAFGHLSHPFDVDEFSFKELKTIIHDSLNGKIQVTREKTDGQNIMVSWKNGKLVAARNKGHIKNFGENAVDLSGIEAMFADRGTIKDAFVLAIKDLQEAIGKLTNPQKEKIFGEGRRFMSVEILYSGNPNVIHYGSDELHFHGTMEYNEAGDPTSQLDKESARMLDGMIRQIQAHRQSRFEIKALKELDLRQVPNFAEEMRKAEQDLAKIMTPLKMTDQNTIRDYKRAWWARHIDTHVKGIDAAMKQTLITRWADGIKNPTIAAITKQAGDAQVAASIKAVEGNLKDLAKSLQLPFEHLFLSVGQTVLASMHQFVAINPDKTLVKMKADYFSALDRLGKSEDPAIIKKLALELERIKQIGGIERLVPTEGITFFHNGELLKLTGLFAPVNQILGMLWRL